MYEHVLDKPLEELENVKRAQKPKKLLLVLTEEEVKMVLSRMEGTKKIDSRVDVWGRAADIGSTAPAMP